MIKKNLYSLFAVLFIFMIYSCAKKQNTETQQHSEIPESVLATIKEMGFNTNGITIMKDGYIVEGDIFLPKSSLGKATNSSNLIIAKSEQYQTNNLVQNLPRTITISVSNLPAVYSTTELPSSSYCKGPSFAVVPVGLNRRDIFYNPYLSARLLSKRDMMSFWFITFKQFSRQSNSEHFPKG